MARPTELAICLAALPDSSYIGDDPGWMPADEIAHRLRRLTGWELTAQQLASRLRRMCEVELPWMERRKPHHWWEYRVTRYGLTDLANRAQGTRLIWDPDYYRAITETTETEEGAPAVPPSSAPDWLRPLLPASYLHDTETEEER